MAKLGLTLTCHNMTCFVALLLLISQLASLRLDLTLLWCKSYDMHGRGNSLAYKQQLYSSSHQCAPPANLKTKNRKEKQKEENKTKEMRNFFRVCRAPGARCSICMMSCDDLCTT